MEVLSRFLRFKDDEGMSGAFLALKNKLSSLKSRSGVRKYFTNTLWVLGDKIIRIVLGLFVTIWMARYLGAESFGLLSYVLSLVGLLTALSTLGLDNIVVKELIHKPEERELIIGSAFFMRVVSGLGTYALLLFWVGYIDQPRVNELLLILGIINIFQSFKVIDFYFQSRILSRYVVIASLGALLFSNGLKIIFILMGAPLVAFVWAVLLEQIVLMVGLVWFYGKTGSTLFRWRFDVSTAKKMLKKSWPLALTAFAASLYMKIDQIMIANILGNDLVGQYAAAVRLTEAIYFIPIVITASLFPAIINARENNVEVYINRLQGLYSLVIYIAIFLAVPMSLFSDQIINILYGPEFAEASEVWIIHIWASIFVFLNAAFAKFLYAESYEVKYLYRSLFGAIVNIIGNFILIPIFSIQGAAFATLISLIAMNYIFDIVDSELRPYLLMKFRCFNPKNILLTLRDL